MPMSPSGGESKSKFMSRCVSHYVHEGREQDQAVAMCIRMWGDTADGSDTNMFMDEKINLNDDVGAKVRRTKDGYLVATPRIARTGVQLYRGDEVGRPDMDVVRVYRPPEEVFSDEAMQSYTWRPISVDHPPDGVNSRNWRKYAVGQLGGDAFKDDIYVRVPMVLMDQQAIDAFESGKRQLSNGYACSLQWQDGVTPDGEKYEAVQRCIRGNHLAIVGAARGGSALTIGDDEHEKGELPMKTIMVDGIPCEMADTAVAVVQRALDNFQKGYEEEEEKKKKKMEEDAAKDAAAAAAIAAKDATIAAKDAEIATLKKQVADSTVTPQALDAMVVSRTNLIDKASAVLGDKLVVDGKSEAEIRKQVVASLMGDTAKGYTDAQVESAFDVLVAKIQSSPPGRSVSDVQRALSQPTARVADEKSKAHDEMVKRLSDAWKPKAA